MKLLVRLTFLLVFASSIAWLAGTSVTQAQVSENDNCRNPGVVMIATAWCGYCRKARQFFRENAIEFDEIDAETTASESIRQTYKRNGVPYIVIGAEEVRGFNERRLRQLLCLPG